MKRVLLVAALLCGGSAMAEEATTEPFTGGNAEAGAAKAATCVACHGPGGNSANPEWPKLAGQHARYISEQLKYFKSGDRKNPVMNAQAQPLSEQDMKDLAAYFSQQKAKPGVGSPDAVKVAEKLYRAGDASRGVPACLACHGPQGNGNAGAGYPRIGGQHAKYTAGALRQLRGLAGAPIPNANLQAMATIAARLTDAEIEALASYINGLH
ncbi:MAG TPA: c-type cytochrome [Verrucomicrobiae bacterium]|nr:c-type cytochrome [Verrucomicrobiae bacterium]